MSFSFGLASSVSAFSPAALAVGDDDATEAVAGTARYGAGGIGNEDPHERGGADQADGYCHQDRDQRQKTAGLAPVVDAQ